MNRAFIGLMSGTSLDGVDGVLVRLSAGEAPLSVDILAHAHRPFPPDLMQELLALNSPGPDELHRAALAGNALARIYAQVTQSVLEQSHTAPHEVSAIGAHGQTVRHRPGEFDGTGYTLQINNAALLAELTHIDVVSDFRTRDVAAGGQGAPLVPAFHRTFFMGSGDDTIAVLNLGGMSNLSVLARDRLTIGFDCGPGNVLMDHWTMLHLQQPCDWGGDWASKGTADPRLLQTMRAEPYFAMPPPKSTGRDLFNAQWLNDCLQRAGAIDALPPEDIQASLAELTAWACEDAIRRHAPDARSLLVCGGGARNDHLMRLLAGRLPQVKVESTAAHGIPVDGVEAVAFAWLAMLCIDRRTGNLPTATGASGPRVLGAVYPAGS
jgi:anhydro-N-acetylmuramic acid kinase